MSALPPNINIIVLAVYNVSRQSHSNEYIKIHSNNDHQNLQLENVAIANALQLEAARATPVISRFNYDAMPSLKSMNLSIAVLLCFCC